MIIAEGILVENVCEFADIKWLSFSPWWLAGAGCGLRAIEEMKACHIKEMSASLSPHLEHTISQHLKWNLFTVDLPFYDSMLGSLLKLLTIWKLQNSTLCQIDECFILHLIGHSFARWTGVWQHISVLISCEWVLQRIEVVYKFYWAHYISKYRLIWVTQKWINRTKILSGPTKYLDS